MEKMKMTTEQKHDDTASDNGEKEKKETPPPASELDSVPEGKAVPYARFKEVVEKRKAAEEALSAVAAELENDVPEEYRPLIPEGLPPAAKIAWIRLAKDAGIFDKNSAPAAPSLDTKRPGGKPPADLSQLNPTQLLSAGYK
jgi:hypothetical protein